jgi:hypothetical protein
MDSESDTNKSMIIRVCFPFYKECPIYDKLLNEVRSYIGEHTFIFKKCQGTIVHDVRNALVADTIRIGKNWKLPEFDVLVMIDSDVDCCLKDIIYICESDEDIIGLPYILRGNEDVYNAGFISDNGYKHFPINTKGKKEIDGQGNGCRGWKRRVFETIQPYWFWPEVITFEDGSIDSLVEDWAFDLKTRKAGFRVWCDFDRPVKHNIKESKMSTFGKNQRAGQTMLNNLSTYIGQLTDLIETLEEENLKLKNVNSGLERHIQDLTKENDILKQPNVYDSK